MGGKGSGRKKERAWLKENGRLVIFYCHTCNSVSVAEMDDKEVRLRFQMFRGIDPAASREWTMECPFCRATMRTRGSLLPSEEEALRRLIELTAREPGILDDSQEGS